MSFDILTIRTTEDRVNDGLHPIAAATPSDTLVAMGPEDGPGIGAVPVTQVVVREVRPGGVVDVCGLSDTVATVYLTDCRLAIGCSRFDTGGGWVGSPGTMLLLNGVSKARARVRSRGKVLVGHVRYSWLCAIGASSKQGWLDSEQVRLELFDRTSGCERRLQLELTLHKPFEAVPMAQEIAHRAALQWLTHGRTTTEQDRLAFERLVSPPPLQPPPKRFAFYTLPVYDAVATPVRR